MGERKQEQRPKDGREWAAQNRDPHLDDARDGFMEQWERYGLFIQTETIKQCRKRKFNTYLASHQISTLSRL